MLESPDEFSARLAQFFLAQKGSLETRSVTGGEHVCFLSSGREQEDQLTNMVISHLLQARKIDQLNNQLILFNISVMSNI